MVWGHYEVILRSLWGHFEVIKGSGLKKLRAQFSSMHKLEYKFHFQFVSSWCKRQESGKGKGKNKGRGKERGNWNRDGWKEGRLNFLPYDITDKKVKPFLFPSTLLYLFPFLSILSLHLTSLVHYLNFSHQLLGIIPPLHTTYPREYTQKVEHLEWPLLTSVSLKSREGKQSARQGGRVSWQR